MFPFWHATGEAGGLDDEGTYMRAIAAVRTTSSCRQHILLLTIASLYLLTNNKYALCHDVTVTLNEFDELAVRDRHKRDATIATVQAICQQQLRDREEEGLVRGQKPQNAGEAVDGGRALEGGPFNPQVRDLVNR